MPDGADYANIRELLGEFIGKTIVEITQHDREFFVANGVRFIDLMFDSGDVLRIWSLHASETLLVVNPKTDKPD